jgi:hypothetical protein
LFLTGSSLYRPFGRAIPGPEHPFRSVLAASLEPSRE